MYSKNPNILSVMTYPPALEGIKINSSVASIPFIFTSMLNYLRKLVRPKDMKFPLFKSCRVYCKHNNSNKWKCPGVFKKQNGKVTLVCLEKNHKIFQTMHFNNNMIFFKLID